MSDSRVETFRIAVAKTILGQLCASFRDIISCERSTSLGLAKRIVRFAFTLPAA